MSLSSTPTTLSPDVIVIGAGPAGLMAAEVLSRAGVAVHVFDAMPSAGRKFLLAGRGGLNLTHSEALAPFIARFTQGVADGVPAHAAPDAVASWLHDFGPDAVREWAAGLGVQTFVGTSGRVFPTEMKAAPLLRAWLHRLRDPLAHGAGAGAVPVQFHMRHRWVGWAGSDADAEADTTNSVAGSGGPTSAAGVFCFESPAGKIHVPARAAVLALGGGSWPRLGSDGAWWPWLAQAGADVAPLRPANCGFDVAPRGGPVGQAAALAARPDAALPTAADGLADPVNATTGWSPFFAQRFAGQPLKNVAISFTDSLGQHFERRGEFVLTATGIEGSLVYAASALLRDEIARSGSATLQLNLLPARTPDQVRDAVAHPRGSRSLSSHLKSRLGLQPVHTALLHERLSPAQLHDAAALAAAIVALPITLRAPRPLAEAISSAGGVRFAGLTDALELRARPGLFCAGEMLDWEAPTGGYLLTASLASGVRAARGVLARMSAGAPAG